MRFPNMIQPMQIPTEFEKSVAPWVGRTEKMMGLFFRDALSAQGIEMTREQFILLIKLHQQDGIMQKDLAFITDRNKGSLARLINTMEKKNLVARIPSDDDKRVNCIHLTRNGRELYQKLHPIASNCIQLLQQGLSESEIETLINLLKKIQQNIVQHTNGCTIDQLP